MNFSQFPFENRGAHGTPMAHGTGDLSAGRGRAMGLGRGHGDSSHVATGGVVKDFNGTMSWWFMVDLPSGYLTLPWYRWPIEIDDLPSYKPPFIRDFPWQC